MALPVGRLQDSIRKGVMNFAGEIIVNLSILYRIAIITTEEFQSSLRAMQCKEIHTILYYCTYGNFMILLQPKSNHAGIVDDDVDSIEL